MTLHTYTNEIIAIAKAQNVSWDIGADMFIQNIRNAGQNGLPYYKGAEHIQYEAMKDYIKELELSKPAFCEAYRKHNAEIIPLRKDGKYDEVKKIMEGEAK